MSTQPGALRLAEMIEQTIPSKYHQHEAAAELRRLVALNQELVEALKLARDALTFTPTLSPAVEELCDDAIQLSNKILAKASGSATQTGEKK